MTSDRVRPGGSPSRRVYHSRFTAANVILMGMALVIECPVVVAQVRNERLKLDPSLISLESKEGDDKTGLLSTSKVRRSYDSLKDVFIEQKTPSYCGVASACMVLDALGVTTPGKDEQDLLFTNKVTEIVSPKQVGRSGMTLKQLGGVLACYRVKVEVVHASDTDLPTFRQSAIDVLSSKDSYLIVNYFRRAVNQETGGHHSPIAAYHEGEDRFLIMDVAQWKYPPVWVKADQLWEAMRREDGGAKTSRGYIIVRQQE